MKKLISAVLIAAMAFNLCSCRAVRKAIRKANQTETTVPQGEAFSLEGMTSDEIIGLFDSLSDINNGDDPASYASRFPVPYYSDQSRPEFGDFCFYENEDVKSFIIGIEYPISLDTWLIDNGDFCYVEIYFAIADRALARELYDKLEQKLYSWKETFTDDYFKQSGDFRYLTVTYDDPQGYKHRQRLTLSMSVPDKGYYYSMSVEYPVIRK